MDRRENKKYNMYTAVENVLDGHIPAIGKIASFQKAYESFKRLLELLSVLDNRYKNTSAGLADQKKKAKAELNEVLLPIANAVYVYATAVNNENLKKQVNVRKSLYKGTRHVEFLQKAKGIFQCLFDHIQNMPESEYAVNAKSLETLKEKIAVYEYALKSKESLTNDSRLARQELKETFSRIDALLHESLDKVIMLAKKDDPDFYNQYFGSRGIKGIGRPGKAKTDDTRIQESSEGVPGL